MTTYTTLVNVDADTAQKLASFIASKLPTPEASNQFNQECLQLIEKLSSQALVSKLLEQNEIILALESNEEVEGCYQALFSIIYSLGDESSESLAIIRLIINKLTSDKAHHAKRRLNALVVLFNLTFSAESKLEVLNAIFNYASETGLFGSVAHFHTRIEDWISSWALTVDQQRALFKIVSTALEKDGQHSQALRVLTRYFQTFRTEATLSAEVEQLMKTAVINAINSPVDSFQDRLVLFESFAGQKASTQWSNLLSLLKIICDGSLEDFQRFQAKHGNTLRQEHATLIQFEEIERKMKLLMITSLAAQASNKIISYTAIATALAISLEEVEDWIIEAIGQGLVDGSMDQTSATFTVHRYTHRSFGMNQWKGLQQKLRDLRKQVHGFVENIQQSTNQTL